MPIRPDFRSSAKEIPPAICYQLLIVCRCTTIETVLPLLYYYDVSIDLILPAALRPLTQMSTKSVERIFNDQLQNTK
jgi:hypothetical protein